MLMIGTEMMTERGQGILAVVNLAASMADGVAVTSSGLKFHHF
jgi:hypothetical protein